MSEFRSIEVTEEVIKEGGMSFPKGPQTVPAAVAERWIRLGWAKDPATGEQGDRKPGVTKLKVADVFMGQK